MGSVPCPKILWDWEARSKPVTLWLVVSCFLSHSLPRTIILLFDCLGIWLRNRPPSSNLAHLQGESSRLIYLLLAFTLLFKGFHLTLTRHSQWSSSLPQYLTNIQKELNNAKEQDCSVPVDGNDYRFYSSFMNLTIIPLYCSRNGNNCEQLPTSSCSSVNHKTKQK